MVSYPLVMLGNYCKLQLLVSHVIMQVNKQYSTVCYVASIYIFFDIVFCDFAPHHVCKTVSFASGEKR